MLHVIWRTRRIGAAATPVLLRRGPAAASRSSTRAKVRTCERRASWKLYARHDKQLDSYVKQAASTVRSYGSRQALFRHPLCRARCARHAGMDGLGETASEVRVDCEAVLGHDKPSGRSALSRLLAVASGSNEHGRGPCRALGRGPPPSDRADAERGALPADLAAPSRRSIVVACFGAHPRYRYGSNLLLLQRGRE